LCLCLLYTKIASKVRHLHNRIAFGNNTSVIGSALAQSPSSYIDALIDDAMAIPSTVAPTWVPLDPVDYEANGFTYGEDENNDLLDETQYAFIKELIDNGVRGRLTLFWHNHFVTIAHEYGFAGYAFRYFLALQRNSFGNFRTFLTEMGLDNAMLKFLNGFESTVESPNENYARELYELFALGEGNGYTEDDIVETSRALTGYNEYINGENSNIIFNEVNFDVEDKTIFEQTGNWGYHDVIDILFDQKSELIARYICEKIYINFVSPEVDDIIRTNIINPLAVIFISNNFEIAPVLKTLFKSAHFFDEKARNTIIKSPLDLIIQFITTTGFNFGDYDIYKEFVKNASRVFDQDIMNPPTVFSGNSNDADVVTKAIFEALMAEVPYTLDDFETGIDIFKSSVPSNYFEDDIWTLAFEGVPLQVRDLIEYIVSLPDYQLK